LLAEHRYNGSVTTLAAARAYLDGWDWAAALDAAHAAGPLAGADEGERLDVIATASWWLGRMDDSIDAREQAYAAFEAAEDERRAGQCAVWLWQDNVLKARPSIAGGWLRRARRLLDAHPGTPEYVELLLREAETAHGAGDLDAALTTARAALTLARSLKARSTEAEALQTIGRVLIDQGDVAEGMGHLDEAMLSAVEGRLTPYATGKIYCSLISACENLGDVRRAAEWTDATLRWSEKHPLAMWPGICRVHHAALLTLRGQWDAAEREAQRACDDIGEFHIGNAASGFAEIGDIRRRLGDLDGAEAAFARAEELTGAPSAGLALLRLAQRRVDAANSIITNLLAEQTWNRLERGKLLPARVQIAVAAGDLDSADDAVSELESIAADFDSPLLSAAALTARGRVLFARGDSAGACTTLREALRDWQGLDVPYEVATVRLLLGQACRACGDEDAATRSLHTAAEIFDRLGAALDVRLTRDLEGAAAVAPGGLTEREAEVLRLVAEGKTNKDIAAELFLSERTVARHLSNIFTKIDVTSRTAAAAFYFGSTPS
jgi:ATP/maltotriose-dependent transcriptional regulator MalT